MLVTDNFWRLYLCEIMVKCQQDYINTTLSVNTYDLLHQKATGEDPYSGKRLVRPNLADNLADMII